MENNPHEPIVCIPVDALANAMTALAHALYWITTHPSRSVGSYIQQGYTMLDVAAGWGEPNTHWRGPECTSISVYRELLPTGIDLWSPGSTSLSFPVPMYQDGWLRPVPSSFLTRVEGVLMNRRTLAIWLTKVLGGRAGIPAPDLEAAMHHPHLLIRLGYRVAKDVAANDCAGVENEVFQAAMCAVGVGARGIDLWTCKNCFRRARGELHLCDLHSQSKVVLRISDVDKVPQVQRARTARLVARQFETVAPTRQGLLGFFETELYEIELRIGSILWPLTGDVHLDWLMHVLRALSKAPAVLSRLPADFEAIPPHAQMQALQEAVGSREWIVTRWPALIGLAETWLQTEAHVAEGSKRQGMNQLNQSRFAIASDLLAQGLSRSEVAVRLGISRSHLSHLLRRGCRTTSA